MRILRSLSLLVINALAVRSSLRRNAVKVDSPVLPEEERRRLAHEALENQAKAVEAARLLSERIAALSPEALLQKYTCKVYVLLQIKEAADRVVGLDARCGGQVLVDLRPAVYMCMYAMLRLDQGRRTAPLKAVAALRAVGLAEEFVKRLASCQPKTKDSADK